MTPKDEPKKPWRVFWIKELGPGVQYAYTTSEAPGSLRVIEHAALEAEQERRVDDVAKLQKELNEARTEISILNKSLRKHGEASDIHLNNFLELKKQIIELREALEYIKAITSDVMSFPRMQTIELVYKRAREVLNKFGRGEG